VSPRVRYGFDERHRFVVATQSRGRRQSIRLAEAVLLVDRQNRLIARADDATDVTLDGAWALTPGHELALTLDETARQGRRTLLLQGAVAQADAHALIFALRQREHEHLRTANRLTLTGRWQADARNRLTFLAEKSDGLEDRLTFQGGWEVGRRHELLYRYRQPGGRGPGRFEHTLRFAGHWDVTASDQLVYRLSGSDRSAFEFRASLQSPSLLASDDRLVYQVGIGLSRGVRRRRVELFGAWKINRDLSVSFEMPYADGRVESIRFEGRVSVTSSDRIAIALQNRRHEPVGLTVTFTRDLSPDARLFLRLRKDAQERSAIGGVQVRF